MERTFRPIHTGSDADLAFAVMVLAAYFTTFSTMQNASTLLLLSMIGLGVAYIAVGIYGYALAARSGKIALHLVYFTVQLLLAGLIIYQGKGAGYNAMVLLPLAGHSVVLMARNWRIVVNLAIVLTFALAQNLFAPNNWSMIWSGLPIFLAGQIFIVVFTQMAVSEERARSEVEGLVKELEQANQQLREYAMQVEELAVTQERNRLAREIHDGLGHYLTTVFIQIQAARAVMKSDPVKSADALGKAQNLTQEALADVRRSVAALRDTPVDSFTLPEEVGKLLRTCNDAGVISELKVIGDARLLTPQSLMTLYRAIQEGISNTLKHARADRLSITLDYSRADQVRLILQDDGRGAENLDGKGFGLLGMRERVMVINGSLQVVTAPGKGFRLEVCVPG